MKIISTHTYACLHSSVDDDYGYYKYCDVDTDFGLLWKTTIYNVYPDNENKVNHITETETTEIRLITTDIYWFAISKNKWYKNVYC